MLEITIAETRKRGSRLLVASKKCSELIHSGEKECYVRIPWENNRRVSYLEAKEMGLKLNKDALKAAIVAASKDKTAITMCNYYIGELGKILDIPYFRDRSYTNDAINNERVADQMNEFLEKAIKNPNSGWELLPSYNIMSEADKGYFIVGSAHSIAGKSKHGHIAIVAPNWIEKDFNCIGKHEPWILDAHMGGSPHVTKSVRYTTCFSSSVTKPIWVKWSGYDWLLDPNIKNKTCVDWDGDGYCDYDEDDSGDQSPEPTPYCVSCPAGYHCVHNPEGCEADADNTPPTAPPEVPA